MIKQDLDWGTIKQKKPKCYKKMLEMKALVQAKCKTCIYKIDCMLISTGAVTDPSTHKKREIK